MQAPFASGIPPPVAVFQRLQGRRRQGDRVIGRYQSSGHPVDNQFRHATNGAGHDRNAREPGLDARPRDPLGEGRQHHRLGGVEESTDVADGTPQADPVAKRLGRVAHGITQRALPGHLQAHVVGHAAHQLDGGQRILLRAEGAEVQQPAMVG